MKFKYICLILLCSIVLAKFEGEFATYSDKEIFVSYNGVKYKQKFKDKTMFTVNASEHKSPSSKILLANINYDLWYNQTLSPFWFTSYEFHELLDTDYFQIGTGIAWIPHGLSDTKSFPFHHKFSYALIKQSDIGYLVNSWRYKNIIEYQKMKITTVYFYKFFMSSININIEYKLNDYLSLQYKGFFKNVKGKEDRKVTIGLSFTLPDPLSIFNKIETNAEAEKK